ncbi:MAG: hypothetical protein A2Z25_22940 [Planctomycetes bacterium RBG_16_55_9]|nr:MAG: hypothetical protein A2Z25_22940 [Planctomycetes bacterium RBG_16_55_9]
MAIGIAQRREPFGTFEFLSFDIVSNPFDYAQDRFRISCFGFPRLAVSDPFDPSAKLRACFTRSEPAPFDFAQGKL